MSIHGVKIRKEFEEDFVTNKYVLIIAGRKRTPFTRKTIAWRSPAGKERHGKIIVANERRSKSCARGSCK